MTVLMVTIKYVDPENFLVTFFAHFWEQEAYLEETVTIGIELDCFHIFLLMYKNYNSLL